MWLSTRRLVLIAPMVEAESLLDQFQEALGFGPRTRSAFDREVDRFVGIPVSEFDAGYQAARVDPVPTLVVHDRGDRQTPYDAAVRLASHLGAQLLSTDGLGHRRVLRDDLVVRAVVTFLNADLGKDQAVA